jgi:AcrR family transcriptional regulator
MRAQLVVSPTPRDRLLDSATRLLLEDGIRAVGITRIIADADVALMTLYRQFDGKDDLVAAAVERWSVDWLEWLEGELDACGDDPTARLDGLWSALDAWFASGLFRGSLVFNAAIELRGNRKHPAHAAIAEHQMALRQIFEALAISADATDPAELAAQLHVLVEGLVAAAIVERRSVDTPRVRALASLALSTSRRGSG